MTIYFQKGPIAFREIMEADLPLITAMRNDFSTWTQLGDPRFLKAGLQRRWLDGLNQSSDRFYFMAVPMAGSRFENAGPPVGLIRMDEYDLVNKSLRVGADVVPSMRKKGYGAQIYSAMESYAFDWLGMHRIWLLVLDTNTPARKLYQSRGFKVEGKMRQAIFRAGAWRDYVMMSMLEPEYRARKR